MASYTLEDIQKMEAEEAEGFKQAVEDWRKSKASGDGHAVVVEAGGAFVRDADDVNACDGNADDGNACDGNADDANDGAIDLSALEKSLSPETLAALRSHVSDQAKEIGDDEGLPKENFGMSQFWWDDASAEMLGQEVLSTPLALLEGGAADSASGETVLRIGVLSGPSVWFGIQRLLENRHGVKYDVVLFEYDTRFATSAKGAFVYYDYNDPDALRQPGSNGENSEPPHLAGSFDYLIAGPPYVSTECIDKYITAFDVLAKAANTPRSIVIGATLEEPLAERGFQMAKDVVLSYQSKFCTPMKLFRRYGR